MKIHSGEVGEMESGEVRTEQAREEIRERAARLHAGGTVEEIGEGRAHVRQGTRGKPGPPRSEIRVVLQANG